MSWGKPPTVLVIEADASLRRLIVLGLQHRGMLVVEASSPSTISALDEQQLSLLVLDMDSRIHSSGSLLEAVQLHPHLSTLPRVVLSWECQPMESIHQRTVAVMQTQVTYLTKPFDARVLHSTIDHLLRTRAAKQATEEARAEEVLLVAYAAQTTPSIWPVITAIGLLLAVIGMMLQVAITVAGVLIVIWALLVWTLDTRPKQRKVAVS